jgi:hypothetical protein
LDVPSSQRAVATLVGDVVASRAYDDQTALLHSLGSALEHLADAEDVVQPPAITIGDEFQGAFATIGAAIRAGLLVRLHLYGEVDVRIGFGWGMIEAQEPGRLPFAQTGPGWWNARSALEHVERASGQRQWPRHMRSAFRGGAPGVQGLLDAFLLCQDQIVHKMDSTDARIATRLLEGSTQKDISGSLPISQPAVARRQMENGPVVLLRAFEAIEGFTP